MLTPPFAGRCLCGAVTFRCDAPPLWRAFCNNETCRLATAAPVNAFHGMADGAWAWTGAPPATFQSSPGTPREFCPTCGTQMACRADRIPGERHFHAATLDDPAAFTPTEHDFMAGRLPRLHLSDGLPGR